MKYLFKACILCASFFSIKVFCDVNDFRNWTSSGLALWSVEEQALIGREGDGFFISNLEYKEFELFIEFWISRNTNSGIFILCQDREHINPESCYELNIWDNHPNQNARTGSIVGKVMPPLAVVATEGKWNTYRVTVYDSTIVVKVNNVLTAIYKVDELRPGFLALQKWGGGEVKFRNLRIK